TAESCAHGCVRSGEGGYCSRWWRRGSDRVLPQHVGASVLLICREIVLRQHVDLPIAHALTQRVALFRRHDSAQRAARDAELGGEQAIQTNVARERHSEV